MYADWRNNGKNLPKTVAGTITFAQPAYGVIKIRRGGSTLTGSAAPQSRPIPSALTKAKKGMAISIKSASFRVHPRPKSFIVMDGAAPSGHLMLTV